MPIQNFHLKVVIFQAAGQFSPKAFCSLLFINELPDLLFSALK